MVSARSLAHALRGEFGPRLRISRTTEGGRAMVYDGGSRPTVAPRPDDAPDLSVAPQPPSGLAGGRFIDDGDEVGFRHGMYRAAREGYDVFAVEPDRAERLRESGLELETFRFPGADGPVERVGFRITPDVRSRLTAGAARLRYGPADDAGPTRWEDFVPEDRAASDGFEYRTNAEGWRQLLPYRDKWGDPANDEGDRGAAMARLQEIGSTDWRSAEWDAVVRAHDDVEEIIAQLYFYRPDISVERASAFDAYAPEGTRFFGGEVRAYMHERESGKPYGGHDTAGRWSMLSPQGERGPVSAEIGDAAREAIEAISKRAGALDLLRGWSRSADARRDRIPAERAPDRAGFVSAVRRAIEGLPDSAFQRDPLALYNTIRKQPNVTGEELDFIDLATRLMARGSRHRWTRPDLLKMVDDHGLRMVRRNNEFDPRLPTRNYNNGGTRAFDGPRVPGPGKYFEERFAFPRRTRGGKKIEPMESSHWEDGVWGSVRGSVRDVEGYGKGILGEELQRDPYQHIASGSAKAVPAKDIGPLRNEQRQARSVFYDASHQGSVIEEAVHKLGLRGDTLPVGEIRRGIEAGDLSSAERALARIEEHVAPLRKIQEEEGGDGSPFARDQQLWGSLGIANDARRAFNVAADLVERYPRFFGPEAVRVMSTDFVPEPPMSDSASVRMLIRALFTRAAREQADWVAIPTGQLNDRIQANTFQSAGHFYDGAARNVLEKVARAIGGDALKVERVVLPTPPLRRGAPVYMVRGLTPEMRTKIRDGLPMFGAAERLPRRRMSIEDVQGEVRNSWGQVGGALLDSDALQVVNDPWDMRHLMDDELIATIPDWVGAVHDYPTGQTFLFADRLSPERVRDLVLHEIGVHHGLEAMVGKKRYRGLQREVVARVKAARERGEAAAAAGARNADEIDPADLFWLRVDYRVRRNYEPNDPAYADELLAYAAEDADQALRGLPEAHPDRTWWQGILDAVRRWLTTSFEASSKVRQAGEAALGALGQRPGISARDVHTLAVASLNRVARERQAEMGRVGAVDGGRVLRYAQARGFEGDDPRMAARWLDRQGYFSPAIEAARRFPREESSRRHMVEWLRSQRGLGPDDVKKDELNTLFLDEFIAGGERATRDEFLAWLRAHRYETELQHGTAAEGVTQWGRYTYLPQINHSNYDAPGRVIEGPDGEDVFAPAGYWEAIVSPRDFDMPGARWDGSHMNTPGVIAHARGADDVEVAGKPAALIIELQSDMWDMKPNDRAIDHRAIFRQADQDVASLREHFGDEAVALWDRVRQYSGAQLMRATSEGPPDVLAIDGGSYLQSLVMAARDAAGLPTRAEIEDPAHALAAASGSTARALALHAEIRKHNSAAERLADERTRQNGGAFGPDPSDQLRAESMRLRGGLTRDRDINAPYRQTWPVKVFTDVVRKKIRDGATRIAWSTREAVNSIPGMASYAGDLYDVRVPRYAREWLGVEAQRGDIQRNSGGKVDLDETEDLMPAVDLAINDTIPNDFRNEQSVIDAFGEFFQDRVLEDDFFFEVRRGAQAPEDLVRLYRNELREEWERGEWDGVMEGDARGIISPDDRDEGELRLLERWLESAVFRAVQEIKALEEGPRGPVSVWYFDVTPEIRERALGARSMFFGAAERDAMPDSLEAMLGAQMNFGPGRPGPVRVGRTNVVDDAFDAADNVVRDVVGDGANYRARGRERGPKQAGLGEMVAGNALGAAVGGVVAAVAIHEEGREERRAEYDRLAEERQKSDAQRGEQAERRADYAAIGEALDSGDWESLPALDPGLMERSEEALKGRQAYVDQMTDIAERFTGIPATFLRELIARETAYTFRPDIRPITSDGRVLSSGLGFGQFIDDTWARELRRSGGRLGVDVSDRRVKDIIADDALMNLRADPRFSTLMVALHARENVLLLQERLGRDVTTAEAYVAHFMGADRAALFIQDVERGISGDETKARYAREEARNWWVFREGGRRDGRPLPARQVMAAITAEFGNDRFHIDEESADGGADGAAAGADE